MVRLRITEVAKAHGISLAAWARKADVDSKTVYRLTSNPYAEVTTFTPGKLADAIGVSIHKLVEDSARPEEGEHAVHSCERYPNKYL